MSNPLAISVFFLFQLQAVINSTLVPNMTFTKTSQKFGQWSDIRANTVYGLGFGTEPDLNKVSNGIFRKEDFSFILPVVHSKQKLILVVCLVFVLSLKHHPIFSHQ